MRRAGARPSASTTTRCSASCSASTTPSSTGSAPTSIIGETPDGRVIAVTTDPDEWGYATRLRRRERPGRDLRRRRVRHVEGVGPHHPRDRRPGRRARARRRRARARPTSTGSCTSACAEQFDVAAFHEYFGTSHDIWESDKGGGMDWAATAPYDAAQALRDGKARYILNTFGVAWATQRGEMIGGPGESHAQELFKQNLEIPFGWFPQPVYFATIARRHMHELRHHRGAARRDRGRVPPSRQPQPRGGDARQAAHDGAVPRVAEVRRAVPQGGLLPHLRRRRRVRHDDARAGARPAASRAVEVAGVGLGNSYTGTHWAQQPAFTSTPQVFAAPAAFAMAGLTPPDVDVYTCYDPFTIVTLMQIEDSGFCEKGDGGEFVERRHAALRLRQAPDQHPRRAAVARVRARHRARGGGRAPAARRGRRAGARRRDRRLRRLHRPAGSTLILRRAHERANASEPSERAPRRRAPHHGTSRGGVPAARRHVGADRARSGPAPRATSCAIPTCDTCGRCAGTRRTRAASATASRSRGRR